MLFTSKFHEQFLARQPISDEEFLAHIDASSLSVDAVNAYRQALGDLYKSPAEHFYPADTFDNLASLPQVTAWDVIYLLMALEQPLKASFEAKNAGHLSDLRGITIGKWLVKLAMVAQRSI